MVQLTSSHGDDLTLARLRAERLLEQGPTVTGPSQQAGLAGMSLLWTLLAAASASRPSALAWVSLAAVGAVVSLSGWIRARRRHTLYPYLFADEERPLRALSPQHRKAVGRQLRGREKATPATAPLVRAMVHWQRKVSRSLRASLIGMGFGLIGVAGTSAGARGGWFSALPALVVLAALFVTVLAVVEARRWRRILSEIETVPSGGSSTGHTSPGG